MHPRTESRRLLKELRTAGLPVLRVTHDKGVLQVYVPSRWKLRHKRSDIQQPFCDPDCSACQRDAETRRRIHEVVERVTGRRGPLERALIREEP